MSMGGLIMKGLWRWKIFAGVAEEGGNDSSFQVAQEARGFPAARIHAVQSDGWLLEELLRLLLPQRETHALSLSESTQNIGVQNKKLLNLHFIAGIKSIHLHDSFLMCFIESISSHYITLHYITHYITLHYSIIWLKNIHASLKFIIQFIWRFWSQRPPDWSWLQTFMHFSSLFPREYLGGIDEVYQKNIGQKSSFLVCRLRLNF